MKQQQHQQQKRQRTAVAVLLLFAGVWMFSQAFVAPGMRSGTTSARMQSAIVVAAGSGEYTGFVPDMQRRMLMNFVTVAASAVPAGVLLGGFAFYFFPQLDSGGGGAIKVGDITGASVSLKKWLSGHKPNDRELVQGLKGDAYYIITTEDGIKDFALNAVCTHLGCVVPWNRAANRFICPCHGSQYNDEGKVVRGPAPLSLALAHASIVDGDIAVSPWPETDFRTDLKPWWN